MTTHVNVWRLIAHHQDPGWAITWSQRNGRIAIGWGLVGDLRQQSFASAAEISAAIRRKYPMHTNSGLGGPSLWNFYAEIQQRDLVILSSGRRRELVLEVQGDYEWTEPSDPKEYPHQRRARVRRLDPDHLWRMAGLGPALGQNSRWTLFRCANPVSAQD